MMPRSGSVSFRLLSARLRKRSARAHQAGASGCLRCMHYETAQILQVYSLQAPVEAFQILLAPHQLPGCELHQAVGGSSGAYKQRRRLTVSCV